MLSFFILSFTFVAQAGPARRGVVYGTQPDGTKVALCLCGDEYGHWYATPDGKPVVKDADGWIRLCTPQEADALVTSAQQARAEASQARLGTTRGGGDTAYRMNDFPVRGHIHGLVLLAAFADKPFCADSTTIHDLLAGRYNGENYSEPFSYTFESAAYQQTVSISGNIVGSARDYFRDQSLGLFTPTFDVVGPITLDNKRIYYGGNERSNRDVNARAMVKEACQKAYERGLVDFADYDNDGDGYVDYVYVVYAGEDEAQFGPEESIWAHAYTLSTPLTLGGKKVYRYACSSELFLDSKDAPAGIGTFVHEFSHVLGLPDFYNTNKDKAYDEAGFCMDYWSLMDYGMYCCNGYVPAGYTSFERYSMGWLPARDLDEPADITLAVTDEDPVMYRTFVNTTDTTSFFVFENIQRTKWNSYLPTYGLLISGVNYSPSAWTGNTVNTAKHRYHIVPANNSWRAVDKNNSEYPDYNPTMHLYGRENFAFGPETTPPSVTALGDTLFKPLTDITRAKGEACTFKFMGGANAIRLPRAVGDETDEMRELYRINENIVVVKRGNDTLKVLIR